MRGWERRMLWTTPVSWRPPSPNLRTPRPPRVSALGLMEGVEISEGRGIEETFERSVRPGSTRRPMPRRSTLWASGWSSSYDVPPRAMPRRPIRDFGPSSVGWPSRSPISRLRSPSGPVSRHRDPEICIPDHFAG
jgi:hypothetical protein